MPDDEFERRTAIREAGFIHDRNAYFDARPSIQDAPSNHAMFEAGFDRGFERGREYAATVVAPALTDEEIDRYAGMKFGVVASVEGNRLMIRQFARTIEAVLRDRIAAPVAAPKEPAKAYVMCPVCNAEGWHQAKGMCVENRNGPDVDETCPMPADWPVAAPVAATGDPWKELFWQVALALKCLPSSFLDGNEHVLRRAKELIAAPVAAPAPLTDSYEAEGIARDLIREALQIGRDAAEEAATLYENDGFTAELKPHRITAAREDVAKIERAIDLLEARNGF